MYGTPERSIYHPLLCQPTTIHANPRHLPVSAVVSTTQFRLSRNYVDVEFRPYFQPNSNRRRIAVNSRTVPQFQTSWCSFDNQILLAQATIAPMLLEDTDSADRSHICSTEPRVAGSTPAGRATSQAPMIPFCFPIVQRSGHPLYFGSMAITQRSVLPRLWPM